MDEQPQKGSTIARDALSGFLVFLIALPLCLGISVASGFPPIAGVLTAIVGGVLITHWGSAELTIKGPAAGLIVITLGAVTELGMGDPVAGYHRALAVGVVAAVIQIIFAVVRAGGLATIMPPTVVHGMLAAIGVIIIAKQIHIAMGTVSASSEIIGTLVDAVRQIPNINPFVGMISLAGLLLLIFQSRINYKLFHLIPAPLWLLIISIPFVFAFNFFDEGILNFFGK